MYLFIFCQSPAYSFIRPVRLQTSDLRFQTSVLAIKQTFPFYLFLQFKYSAYQ